jgi:[acyl-carrier-protein] S-malonyltransferase
MTITNTHYGFVFPGQGSQTPGMLADIAEQYPEVLSVFAEASAALGYDLWKFVQTSSKEELDKTEFTQPALLAAGYAVWKIIRKNSDIQPVLLAGHSLGEYTALTCAGSLQFADAIKLVAARGRFMQEAVHAGEGAMAAIIGLDDETVADICQQTLQANEVLSPANFNSIGQVVIAGHSAAVLRAVELAKEKGARMAVIIPVSVPSHCALMKPAAERLAELLNSISVATPILPVLNNVDAKIYENAEQIRDGLVRQLYMSVRWVDIINYYVNANVKQIIECGPGKILTGVNKRIDKSLLVSATNDLLSLDTVLKSHVKGIAQ